MATNVQNILLTGFRATGKTLVGTILSQKTGRRFIDTDQKICQLTAMSISDMVARYGWKRFREEEEKVLKGLLHHTGVVVAVGGGAIEHQQVWKKLCHVYFIVWLQADPETIFQRIQQDQKSREQRPALTENGGYNEIRELLNKRNPLYRQGADMCLDTTKLSPQLLAEKIIMAIKEPS